MVILGGHHVLRMSFIVWMYVRFCRNCIPPFLLDLHNDYIQQHGNGHPSLSKTMYDVADKMSFVNERLQQKA